MVTGNVEISYRGWIIRPLAIPHADGGWLASCEIEKFDAPLDDDSQGLLGDVLCESKEDAIAQICKQARHQIDAITAVPIATEADGGGERDG